MSKQRKGGEHKTPRVPVQLPKPWMDLAREIAKLNKQPATWLLISLLAEEAARRNMILPELPWE